MSFARDLEELGPHFHGGAEGPKSRDSPLSRGPSTSLRCTRDERNGTISDSRTTLPQTEDCILEPEQEIRARCSKRDRSDRHRCVSLLAAAQAPFLHRRRQRSSRGLHRRWSPWPVSVVPRPARACGLVEPRSQPKSSASLWRRPHKAHRPGDDGCTQRRAGPPTDQRPGPPSLRTFASGQADLRGTKDCIGARRLALSQRRKWIRSTPPPKRPFTGSAARTRSPTLGRARLRVARARRATGSSASALASRGASWQRARQFRRG
jgi:hypothetical protein